MQKLQPVHMCHPASEHLRNVSGNIWLQAARQGPASQCGVDALLHFCHDEDRKIRRIKIVPQRDYIWMPLQFQQHCSLRGRHPQVQAIRAGDLHRHLLSFANVFASVHIPIRPTAQLVRQLASLPDLRRMPFGQQWTAVWSLLKRSRARIGMRLHGRPRQRLSDIASGVSFFCRKAASGIWLQAVRTIRDTWSGTRAQLVLHDFVDVFQQLRPPAALANAVVGPP